jgi:hypothetical protein
MKFPDLVNIFPVNFRGELREKWLRHTGFLLLNRLSEPQNCNFPGIMAQANLGAVCAIIPNFPCKIPCQQGICVETGAISTASPARQSSRMRISLREWQKSPPMAGFCNSESGLRIPNLADCGLKSPKVSGGSLKYSRFRETAAGDRVRSALRGGACNLTHEILRLGWLTCDETILGNFLVAGRRGAGGMIDVSDYTALIPSSAASSLNGEIEMPGAY